MYSSLVLLAVAVSFVIAVSPTKAPICKYVSQGPNPAPLVCKYMTSESDFEEHLLAENRDNTSELIVEYSDLRFFPHDVFAGTKFRKIAIRNCTILDLSNSKLAFEGLEDHLEKLVVDETSFVSHWNWVHLKNLRKLRELYVRYSDLVFVPENMQNVSRTSIEHIELPYNDITVINDRAFARLHNLKYLILDHNDIFSIKRTMFPVVNNSLEVLSFSYNSLPSLPPDIFVNMTKLKAVKLSGNRIWTIDEKTFSPVWEQLYALSLAESPLSCDCRIKWIALKSKKKNPKMVFATCHSPARLKGKFIMHLSKKDLWC